MNNYFTDFYIDMIFSTEGLLVNNLIAALVPFLVEDLRFRNIKDAGIFALKIIGSILAMNVLCVLSYIVLGGIAMSQICGAILVTAYLAVFSKSSSAAKIIYGCSFCATIQIVLLSCFSVLDVMIEPGNVKTSFFIDLLIVMLMVGCVLFFKTFSVDKLKETIFASVGVVCAAGATCTGFWIITNVTHIDAVVRLAIGMMLLVLLLAAYYSAYAISRTVERNNRLRIAKLLREADENMLGTVERNIEELRRIRHEINNQYLYMKLLLRQGEYEKLEEYFAGYSEKLSSLVSFVDCGNRVVSAVMNVELQKAEKAGIRIDYRLTVPPETRFSDYDLCSLLFNILNNAIEYLTRKPDADSDNEEYVTYASAGMSNVFINQFSGWTLNEVMAITVEVNESGFPTDVDGNGKNLTIPAGQTAQCGTVILAMKNAIETGTAVQEAE